jgi:thioredoxin 1
MAAANIVHVEANNWQSEVDASNVPVLVDFWAEWCAPCKAIAPALDELSGEFAGKLKIVKVDVDTNPELAGKYNVRSIPTLLLIKGGTVQMQHTGALTKAALKSKIEPLLG